MRNPTEVPLNRGFIMILVECYLCRPACQPAVSGSATQRPHPRCSKNQQFCHAESLICPHSSDFAFLGSVQSSSPVLCAVFCLCFMNVSLTVGSCWACRSTCQNKTSGKLLKLCSPTPKTSPVLDLLLTLKNPRNQL